MIFKDDISVGLSRFIDSAKTFFKNLDSFDADYADYEDGESIPAVEAPVDVDWTLFFASLADPNLTIPHAANLVSSVPKEQPFSGKFSYLEDTYHRVVIDLDVEAYLVPSSTPGHSHLYINHPIEESQYFNLLDQLVTVGLVQEGYARASRARGFSAVRLPWVNKEY